MSHTCDVCRGALPDGVGHAGHTALCAQVVLERLTVLRRGVDRLTDDLVREWQTIAGTEAGDELWRIVTKLRDLSSATQG